MSVLIDWVAGHIVLLSVAFVLMIPIVLTASFATSRNYCRRMPAQLTLWAARNRALFVCVSLIVIMIYAASFFCLYRQNDPPTDFPPIPPLAESVREWLVLLGLLAISALASYVSWRAKSVMGTMLITGATILLLSIGLACSAVPSARPVCSFQWLETFVRQPWTRSCGALGSNRRETLLWAPGVLFAVFVAWLTMLGYVVSKAAIDTLHERVTSRRLTRVIGEAMFGIAKAGTGDLYIACATPLVGNVTDRITFESAKGVKPFWDWILGRQDHLPAGYPGLPEMLEGVTVRILALTERGVADFYGEIGNSKNRDKVEAGRKESEKYLRCLVAKSETSGGEHIEVKRRDNLPMAKLLVVQSPEESVALIFYTIPSGRGGIEVHGFTSRDPFVVDLLRRFFMKAWDDEELVTSVAAYLPSPPPNGPTNATDSVYASHMESLTKSIAGLLQKDGRRGQLKQVWIMSTTPSLGNLTLKSRSNGTYADLQLAIFGLCQDTNIQKQLVCLEHGPLKDFYTNFAKNGITKADACKAYHEAEIMISAFGGEASRVQTRPPISVWAVKRNKDSGECYEAVFYLTETEAGPMHFQAFRTVNPDLVRFLIQLVEGAGNGVTK